MNAKISDKVRVTKNKKGQKVIDDYTVVGKLGQGGHAKVFLVNKAGQEFAMKVVNSSYLEKQKIFVGGLDNEVKVRSLLDDIKNELWINARLNHKNIIKIFKVITNEEKGKMYIVMEYCAKGSLLSWNPSTSTFHALWSKYELTEEVMRHLFKQVIEAVEYLHSNYIVHFDIKPQNVLVAEDYAVKLNDFDQACDLLSDDLSIRQPGTLQCFPPESLGSIRHITSHRAKAIDIWGLGVTLYALVYGRLPFNGNSLEELFEDIKSKEYWVVRLEFEGKAVSEGLLGLLRGMLDKDPNTRVTINEIMENQWMNE